jgi:hypothetical protein
VNNTLLIAELILTILLILSIVVSMFKFIAKISSLETAVNDMKSVLGNGQDPGIRQDVQEIKINCAGEMANIKARVHTLEQRNGKPISEVKV